MAQPNRDLVELYRLSYFIKVRHVHPVSRLLEFSMCFLGEQRPNSKKYGCKYHNYNLVIMGVMNCIQIVQFVQVTSTN